MKHRPIYTIEYYFEQGNKWMGMFPFTYMQKSYAEGAWAMLKSFYNKETKYRLLKDGVVIDEGGKQIVSVS